MTLIKKCSCGIDGFHLLAEHDNRIRTSYAMEKYQQLGAPGHQCTCGMVGVHTYEEHDGAIERKVTTAAIVNRNKVDAAMSTALIASAAYHSSTDESTHSNVIATANGFCSLATQ